MTIQDIVLLYILDMPESFSIYGLQAVIFMGERGLALSYKQVRDAIYRMNKLDYRWRHLVLGTYIKNVQP